MAGGSTNTLFEECQRLTLYTPHEINTLVSAFATADKNVNGRLSLKEFRHCLCLLNLDVEKAEGEASFTSADTDADRRLSFAEFVAGAVDFESSDALRRAYDALLQGRSELPLAAFCSYLKLQGEPFTAALVSARPTVPWTAFASFIHSDRNTWVAPSAAPAEDMTQPLHHYFVESSHNTYLSGNQLWSSSSVEEYRRALLAGVRCVEIDAWDGPEGEPVVTHGHTLTSKISTREVLQCIHDHGFTASPYPVIISLENHLSNGQQVELAGQLRTILGRRLRTIQQGHVQHATPEGLKGCVIIKCKITPGAEEDSAKKPSKATEPALAALVGMTGVKVSDPRDHLQTAVPYQCASFTEKKALELYGTRAQDFIGFNRRCFSRVYPAGTRVDSGNYEGAPMFYGLGCQLVALNYQTHDRPVRLNRAFFRAHGNRGYVLKPSHLRLEGASAPQPLTLELTILSGHRLQPRKAPSRLPSRLTSLFKDVLDPYVLVRLCGPSGTVEYRTATMRNNPARPEWHETFALRVEDPLLTFLSVEVHDDDPAHDDFIGEGLAPVSALRNGLHSVPLTDAHGDRLRHAHLLVTVTGL